MAPETLPLTADCASANLRAAFALLPDVRAQLRGALALLKASEHTEADGDLSAAVDLLSGVLAGIHKLQADVDAAQIALNASTRAQH